MIAIIGLAAIAFIIWWFWLHPDSNNKGTKTRQG